MNTGTDDEKRSTTYHVASEKSVIVRTPLLDSTQPCLHLIGLV